MRSIPILLVLALTGCISSADLPALVQALAQDPANNCVRVVSPYFSIEMARLAGSGSTQTCGALQMARDAASSTGTVNVPVKVNVAPLTAVPAP